MTYKHVHSLGNDLELKYENCKGQKFCIPVLGIYICAASLLSAVSQTEVKDYLLYLMLISSNLIVQLTK